MSCCPEDSSFKIEGNVEAVLEFRDEEYSFNELKGFANNEEIEICGVFYQPGLLVFRGFSGVSRFGVITGTAYFDLQKTSSKNLKDFTVLTTKMKHKER